MALTIQERLKDLPVERGLTDPQLKQLVAAHIDDDSFCRYVIQQDINKIAFDLREAHKNDFFSVPEDRTTRWKISCRPPRKPPERTATRNRRL